MKNLYSLKEHRIKTIVAVIGILLVGALMTMALANDAKEYANDPRRFIAHAGGQYNGYKYTNSLEALDYSYAKGHRLFELDIIKTSDGQFVAAHDWKKWKKITGYGGETPPTKAIFLTQPIYNDLTALDMDRINEWFSEHKDAILVTDKINEPVTFSEAFVDKKRLMMELFTWRAVKQALDLKIKSAMPTGRLIFKISGDKIKYLNDLKITDIAISRNYLATELVTIDALNSNGFRLFAFHIKSRNGKGEQQIICNERHHFFGMYADVWNKDIWQQCK